MNIQTTYQNTLKFAAGKHEEIQQKIPDTQITYVVHLCNVTMEILIANEHSLNFNANFAVQVTLLHDVLEDTKTSFEELHEKFGSDVANGVQALTKNDKLENKSEKITDSLARIKQQPKEVWAVKLADRITNLQIPPSHWSQEKIKKYAVEANQILDALSGCNPYLEERLRDKILDYNKFYIIQKM